MLENFVVLNEGVFGTDVNRSNIHFGVVSPRPLRLHFVVNSDRGAVVTIQRKPGLASGPRRPARRQERAPWLRDPPPRERRGRPGGLWAGGPPQARDGGRTASAGAGRERETHRSGGGGGGPGGGGRLLLVVARRWRPYLAAGSGQQSER